MDLLPAMDIFKVSKPPGYDFPPLKTIKTLAQ
jgi:hypothetical protein